MKLDGRGTDGEPFEVSGQQYEPGRRVVVRARSRPAGQLLGSLARRKNTPLAGERDEDALPVVRHRQVDMARGGRHRHRQPGAARERRRAANQFIEGGTTETSNGFSFAREHRRRVVIPDPIGIQHRSDSELPGNGAGGPQLVTLRAGAAALP
jgi:hypothetical protein